MRNQQSLDQLQQERIEKEQLAQRLSEESGQQWQKAIEGLFALPAAVALSVAASALYAIGFLARGFEVFQRVNEEGRGDRDEVRRGNGEGYEKNRGVIQPGSSTTPSV